MKEEMRLQKEKILNSPIQESEEEKKLPGYDQRKNISFDSRTIKKMQVESAIKYDASSVLKELKSGSTQNGGASRPS